MTGVYECVFELIWQSQMVDTDLDCKPSLSQLAQKVTANPLDVAARFRFVTCSNPYYGFPARSEPWRRLRFTYVLWLTERFPQSPSLASGMPSLYPAGTGDTTNEEYRTVRDLRVRLADHSPNDAVLQANTGYFFSRHELFLAKKYYQRALTLEPASYVRGYDLGNLYAETILRAMRRLKNVNLGPASVDLNGFATHVLAQLRIR